MLSIHQAATLIKIFQNSKKLIPKSNSSHMLVHAIDKHEKT
jgi:hypothetical protein